VFAAAKLTALIFGSEGTFDIPLKNVSSGEFDLLSAVDDLAAGSLIEASARSRFVILLSYSKPKRR